MNKIGATLIHPYDNFHVISGQGTACKELMESYPDLDSVLVPVGGGGLLSGTAIAAKHLSPKCKVVAAEPLGADDAYQSYSFQEIDPTNKPANHCRWIVNLGWRKKLFNYARQSGCYVVTVSEHSIVSAMRMVWERMKLIIEPSSAVPLAAILENKVDVSNKKVGIILSGGNVDLEKLPF